MEDYFVTIRYVLENPPEEELYDGRFAFLPQLNGGLLRNENHL